MHSYIHTFTALCNIYIYVHIYLYIYMFVYIYKYTYVCVRIYIYIYTYIYMYIYTYTYIYTHIYIYPSMATKCKRIILTGFRGQLSPVLHSARNGSKNCSTGMPDSHWQAAGTRNLCTGEMGRNAETTARDGLLQSYCLGNLICSVMQVMKAFCSRLRCLRCLR